LKTSLPGRIPALPRSKSADRRLRQMLEKYNARVPDAGGVFIKIEFRINERATVVPKTQARKMAHP
jgi:hypothetical protein